MAENDLLDVDEACKFIGGSRPINPATLWRNVRAKRISPPIHISAQLVRWRRSDLEADVARMVAERDAKLVGVSP
jgi:predicted DNA-binding transcriptional regulator AlpA